MSSQSDCDGSGDERSDFSRIGECTWRKLRKEHQKTGFIDGRYHGAEKSKKAGFAKGYERGFNASLHIALLKGVICAASVYLQTAVCNGQRTQEAQQLKEEVETLQQRYIEYVSSEENAMKFSPGTDDESEVTASFFYNDIKMLKEKTVQFCNNSGCSALKDLVLSL